MSVRPRAGIGSLVRLTLSLVMILILVVAAVAITGVAAPGDGRSIPTPGTTLPVSAGPTSTSPATPGAVVASARVVPIRVADLAPEVAGTVRRVVKEGQRVEAEEVVVRLDATREQAAVDRAEAAVTRAEAAVGRARARRDLLTAKATEAERRAADAEVTFAEADLEAARSALQETRVALAQRQVKAPFAGTIAGVSTGVGKAVKAGQTLLTVADMSTWRLETKDLDELEVLRVAEGHRVLLEFPALRGVTLTGVVQEIHARGVDDGAVTYTAVIAPDRHEPRLRWNMTARVTFTGT